MWLFSAGDIICGTVHIVIVEANEAYLVGLLPLSALSMIKS